MCPPFYKCSSLVFLHHTMIQPTHKRSAMIFSRCRVLLVNAMQRLCRSPAQNEQENEENCLPQNVISSWSATHLRLRQCLHCLQSTRHESFVLHSITVLSVVPDHHETGSNVHGFVNLRLQNWRCACVLQNMESMKQLVIDEGEEEGLLGGGGLSRAPAAAPSEQNMSRADRLRSQGKVQIEHLKDQGAGNVQDALVGTFHIFVTVSDRFAGKRTSHILWNTFWIPMFPWR